MQKDRIKKANSISQRLISGYIQENFKEHTDEFGLISVTGVEISSDLSYIDIYVSALKNTDSLTKTLKNSSHEIERLLGKEIAFLKVPKVRFRYDDTIQTSSDIYDILKSISK